MAVAACSLEEPWVRLEDCFPTTRLLGEIDVAYTAKVEARHQDVTSLSSRAELGIVVLHAHLGHFLLGNVILIGVFASAT